MDKSHGLFEAVNESAFARSVYKWLCLVHSIFPLNPHLTCLLCALLLTTSSQSIVFRSNAEMKRSARQTRNAVDLF